MEQILVQINKGNAAAEEINRQTTETFEKENVKAKGQKVLNRETLLSLEEEFQ